GVDQARERRVLQVRLAQSRARGDLVLPPVDRDHQGADERPDVSDHARRPRAGDAGTGEVGPSDRVRGDAGQACGPAWARAGIRRLLPLPARWRAIAGRLPQAFQPARLLQRPGQTREALEGTFDATDVFTGGGFSFGSINITTGAFTAINTQGGSSN